MTDVKKRRRADSRAKTPCPHCGWKAHGARGLEAHIAAKHAAPAGQKAGS